MIGKITGHTKAPSGDYMIFLKVKTSTGIVRAHTYTGKKFGNFNKWTLIPGAIVGDLRWKDKSRNMLDADYAHIIEIPTPKVEEVIETQSMF
jgi:hypothetical protein